METKELMERYLEETGILEDEKVIAIIAYGSRVTNKANDSSDLDVLVISIDITAKFCSSRIIDGIIVETNYMPDCLLFDDISTAYFFNNSYFESVFETGVVIKDSLNIVESYKEHIKDLKYENIKRKKRIPLFNLAKIENYLSLYKSEEDPLKPYYYYNLLELIRKAYHYLHNYSYLTPGKVYKLYSDVNLGNDIYKMHLPDKNFRDLYLKAISAQTDERDDIIVELLKLLDYKGMIGVNLKDSYDCFPSRNVRQIKKEIVSINKRVCKLEEMLIYDYPDKEYMYFLTLNNLYNYYYKIYDNKDERFEELYNLGITTYDTDARIELIEEMFSIIDKEYRFDYDDYILRYD